MQVLRHSNKLDRMQIFPTIQSALDRREPGGTCALLQTSWSSINIFNHFWNSELSSGILSFCAPSYGSMPILSQPRNGEICFKKQVLYTVKVLLIVNIVLKYPLTLIGQRLICSTIRQLRQWNFYWNTLDIVYWLAARNWTQWFHNSTSYQFYRETLRINIFEPRHITLNNGIQSRW